MSIRVLKQEGWCREEEKFKKIRELPRGNMNLSEIKKKAQGLGIKPGKMKKVELIHAIQLAEHNTPCFGTTHGECSQSGCCFIKDCLKVKVTV